MGLRDLFIKQAVDLTPEQLDLLLESEEKPPLAVTRQKALSLPSVYANVELIANTIGNLEIKLYKEYEGSVEEVKEDYRTLLLNDEPNAFMTGDELKKAMVRDYLLEGNCYVYIEGQGLSKDNQKLHYIPTDKISLLLSPGAILKEVTLLIEGQSYDISQFIICTKNTLNGVEGRGIVAECNDILKQALDNMEYTSRTMGNGGVKRGVLQSTRRLTAEAIAELKKAWKRLYEKNNDCIVLNEGITYHELQQTGAEMQMIESKSAIDADICKLFNVPINMFDSSIPAEVWDAFVKLAITPILDKFEKVLNKCLLETEEKGKYYFAFDTKQLNKGDIEKRFKAYEIALKNGFMTPSEVRFEEDLNEITTLNFVKLNLGDVLMDIASGSIYTPNTNTTVNQNYTNVVQNGAKNDTKNINMSQDDIK
ncbi:phage portal protein [Cellulosilyticum sp. ST5]|uniref:phage portal protein n=1 Tax=Cellulosilyticum sp. ST5 TaxID=3055805 RepID=UPI00397768BB